MISVLVADDHPLILRGIRELFVTHDDIEVVGEEVDPKKVIEVVRRLEPDVLIQDLSMAGEMSGLDVIRSVHRRFPKLGIVVLSMHSTLAPVCEAFRLGALGYVSKLGDMEELVEAVHLANAGRRYIGQPFDITAIDNYLLQVADREREGADMLTKRELEILSLVAYGFTSGEIAKELHIGRRTVESHRSRMTTKLGARNQAELVRFAIERGLVAVR